MSPKCGKCGTHVSQDYVRVNCPRDRDQVRTCPSCNYLRDGQQIRKKQNNGHTTPDILADGGDDDNGADWSEVVEE